MLERRQAVGCRLDAAARITDGERCPIREVLRRRGTVTGDIAVRDLGECVVAAEPAGVRRPFGDERVRVLAVDAGPLQISASASALAVMSVSAAPAAGSSARLSRSRSWARVRGPSLEIAATTASIAATSVVSSTPVCRWLWR